MEEEANHLFKNDLHLLIDLDKGSVAHEEGTQRLYQGDLQWKVERGDHRHSTKGPSVSTGPANAHTSHSGLATLQPLLNRR
mmetsp:Transcript_19260/g.37181  ORF Transcript_19260/g.37181 Transcript_19260/m.37181 type:complete len:81 (+) Transcript_19260:441-683(+)